MTRVVSKMARRVKIVIRRVKKVIRMVTNPRMVTIPKKVPIQSQDLLSVLECCPTKLSYIPAPNFMPISSEKKFPQKVK